jgi:hypothetical protein
LLPDHIRSFRSCKFNSSILAIVQAVEKYSANCGLLGKHLLRAVSPLPANGIFSIFTCLPANQSGNLPRTGFSVICPARVVSRGSPRYCRCRQRTYLRRRPLRALARQAIPSRATKISPSQELVVRCFGENRPLITAHTQQKPTTLTHGPPYLRSKFIWIFYCSNSLIVIPLLLLLSSSLSGEAGQKDDRAVGPHPLILRSEPAKRGYR